RQSYRDRLPESVWARPKVAYQAPEMRPFFTNGRPRPEVADMLTPDRIARDGNFDPAVVDLLLRHPPAEGHRQGFRENMMFVLILSTTLLKAAFEALPPVSPVTMRTVECPKFLRA
ncbi:MAG: hypothetical protein HQL86_06680, partial [Magnetococcales bacterium]|nr:hypothetical protein [Magnetococcales bacterium]